MESIDPQQTEVLSAWDQSLAEIASKHNAMATPVSRIETHLTTIAQDQSNAKESNQATWRSTEEQSRIRVESDRIERQFHLRDWEDSTRSSEKRSIRPSR